MKDMITCIVIIQWTGIIATIYLSMRVWCPTNGKNFIPASMVWDAIATKHD